jgi:hypothetical protein
MHKARRPATRTHAHEAFFRFPVNGLRADVARLPLCVLGARLRRNRDGLRVLLIGIILLSAAAFFNLSAELVMAAFFPVLFLARKATVARFAAAALLGRAVWERGSARGAYREDHLSLLQPRWLFLAQLY